MDMPMDGESVLTDHLEAMKLLAEAAKAIGSLSAMIDGLDYNLSVEEDVAQRIEDFLTPDLDAATGCADDHGGYALPDMDEPGSRIWGDVDRFAPVVRGWDLSRPDGADAFAMMVKALPATLTVDRADFTRLVIAARNVAWSDPEPEAITELQQASEAFASAVGWDDEPNEPIDSGKSARTARFGDAVVSDATDAPETLSGADKGGTDAEPVAGKNTVDYDRRQMEERINDALAAIAARYPGQRIGIDVAAEVARFAPGWDFQKVESFGSLFPKVVLIRYAPGEKS